MKQTKITLGLLTAVFGFAGMASSTYAFDGTEPPHDSRGFKRHISTETHEQIKATIENNDYAAYVALAQEQDLRHVMSEEHFAQRQEKMKTRQQAHTAALNENYEAWRAVVGDQYMSEVTEENFSLVVNMAQAFESRDKDAMDSAKDALKEAGIERPHKERRPGHRVRGGDRPNFGERHGFDKESVANMTDTEKQNLLNTIIAQIKERLGLD